MLALSVLYIGVVGVESGEGGIGRAAPCGPISEGDIVVAIIDPQELATDVKY